MTHRSLTTILIRATVLDSRVMEFADTLAAESGCAVAFVLDESCASGTPCTLPVVGLSPARCAALGLFCPPDFAWKCGDYGYYLARKRFPLATHFWLIEYDVRFLGGDLSDFFTSFASRPEIDFIAAFLGPAGWDWHWAITARGRDVNPMRCLFPVTRLSAHAIDALLAKRVAHGRRALRRFLWPNDEAMVATTLCHGDFECRDLNDFQAVFYTSETFSFSEPIRGESFSGNLQTLQIYHPVLYGDQYDRKIERLKEVQAPSSWFRDRERRVAAKINSLMSW